MALLGEYIQEETHPVGESGGNGLNMIGVSNERGLEVSSRSTSSNISRYIEVRKDWFAYNPMRINVGSIGLADDISKTGFTSPDYTVFSCKDGLLPKYLLRFLKSEYGLEAVVRHSSGAVRKRLYFSGLSKIELDIPSIEDQLNSINRFQIAEQATRFIQEHNSNKVEIPLLKQAILQEAIQGKLTADWRAANRDTEPASKLLERIKEEKARLIAEKKIKKEKPLPEITPEETPFAIPEGWEWCRFSETSINLDTNRKPISKKERELKEKVYPYYGASGVIDAIDSYTHEGNFLLIGEDGSNLRLRSTPIAFSASGKIWVNNHAHVLRFIDSVTQKFVENRINGMDINSYVTGGFQPKLSQGNLNKISIPLPPLAEQEVIVERVDALMETFRRLEDEIEQSSNHAADLLQAVLKEAFASAS